MSRITVLLIIVASALIVLPLGATNRDSSALGTGPERQLEEAGFDVTVPSLIAALADSTLPVEIRFHSARALGNSGRAEVMPALIEALTDSESRVRLGAVSGLVSLGSAVAVPDLRMVLLSDPDTQVREAAMWALAEIGTGAALTALAEAASDESETRSIRINSILYMGRKPREPSLGPLFGESLRNEDSEIRAAAAVSAAHARVGLNVIPHLAEAALDTTVGEPLRREAVRFLEELTGEDFLYTRSDGGFAQGSEREEALKQLEEWWKVERAGY